jgi:hypothetical protein
MSLSANGLIVTYEGRAIVGIGAFGFVTGPFVGVGTSIGVTRGSDASDSITPPCRQADLTMWVRAGVGYAIPQSVAKVLNFILSVFNVAPIKSSGGPGVLVDVIKPQHQAIGCGVTSG